MPKMDSVALVELIFINHPKIYYLATIGLLVTVLIHFYTKNQLMDNNSAEIVKLVLSSFSFKPINDVRLHENDGSCPRDYESLEFGEWFGTYDGCACSLSMISQGYCSASAYDCVSVSGLNPVSLYKWKNTVFCYSRVKDIISNYGPTCPDGYINCGGNTFCIPNITYCPITNVTISDMSTYQQDPNDNILYLNYNSPNTSNTTTGGVNALIFRRDSGNSSLYKFSVSFYDIPCLNPSVFPISKTFGGYPLMRIDETGCLYYGNLNSSLQIDEVLLSDIFNDNNLANNVSALPFYSNYINGQKAYLMGLLRFSINQMILPCQNMNLTNLLALNKYEGDFDYMVVCFGMTEIAVTALLLILYPVEMSIRNKLEDEDDRISGITIVTQILYLALCSIYISLGFYIYFHNANNFLPNFEYFKTISTLNCFTDYAVNIAFRDFFRNLGSNFNGVVYYFKVLLILSCVSLGIWIMTLLAKLILAPMKRKGVLQSVETEEDQLKTPKRQTGIEMLFTNKD